MDAMVTSLFRPAVTAALLRRAVALVVIVVVALVGPAAVASAQPASPGTAYGFSGLCVQLHDDLDDIGIPGTPLNLGNAVSGACEAGNVATHPGGTVQAVKDKAWDSTFGKVVDSMLTGLGQAVSLGLAFWAKVPNSAVDDLPSLMGKVRDYTNDIQLYILAASVMFCAVRLAAARASAAAEEATEAFRVLARTTVASGMWAGLIVLGTHASDAFADWVINDSTNNNASGVAKNIIAPEALTAFSPGLIVVFAVVGLLSAILQIVLAVVRQGLLVVVTGILPLSAAASGTRAGQQAYHRLLLWSVAFVLYKPLAALAYMIAFTAAGNNPVDPNAKPDTDTAVRALVSIALLCSVAFVLPAIMRLIAPVTSMGSGSSGAVRAAGVLAGGGGAMGMLGRLATGAADSRGGGVVSRNQGGGGGGGGTRPTGAAVPSGPTGSGPNRGGSAGPAGATAPAKAGAAGAGGAATKAAGPYGAAAAAAGQVIGGGLRAANTTGTDRSQAVPL
ncbi:hypothetical protein ACFYTQ_35395 [Nocardia sp. NPDC004068]|uniref:hypothetical protein n=1 Tax=Nocardia sp. NPDC004068 TaxID=3364303 RepID=UPI0036AAB192